MYTQNFIKLNLAICELSWQQRKNKKWKRKLFQDAKKILCRYHGR